MKSYFPSTNLNKRKDFEASLSLFISRYLHGKIHTAFKAIGKRQAIEIINQMNAPIEK
jgi:hypothetical protein